MRSSAGKEPEALEAHFPSLSIRAPDEDLNGAQRTESEDVDAEEEGDEVGPLDQHQPLLPTIAGHTHLDGGKGGTEGFAHHSKAVWIDVGRNVSEGCAPQGR